MLTKETTLSGHGNNGIKVRTVTVGTNYPADRAAMLDVVKERWGKTHRSDVIRVALDRLLISEGFSLDDAA